MKRESDREREEETLSNLQGSLYGFLSTKYDYRFPKSYSSTYRKEKNCQRRQ